MDSLNTSGIKTCLFFISFFLFSNSIFALVDYSDDDATPVPVKTIKKRPRIKRLTSRAPNKSRSTNKVIGDFEINSKYETIDLPQTKVSMMEISTHFQTPYNFFLEGSYYTIQSDNPNDEIISTGYQRGNPKVLLGLQWLEFGKSEEKVNLDLLVGMSYKSTGPHTTSRTDKYVGIQTMKRFYSFVLGLSYVIRATGNPNDEQEMAVGNIATFGAELGVMVSNDIQFSLLAQSIRIKKGESEERLNILDKDISFSYISPKLTLGLGKLISLDLGAIFRTDKIRNSKTLIPARLWDVKGVYGNSIFAGLNFSI